MKLAFVIFLMIASCTRMKEKQSLQAEWIGRPVSELNDHPYFLKFPLDVKSGDEHEETRIYKDGRPVLTKARQGFPDVWCEHIFTIRNGRITGFKQYGPCPYDPAARRKD